MKSDDLKNDCWVQAGYLPLTAHWYALLFPLLSECERQADLLFCGSVGRCRMDCCPITFGSEFVVLSLLLPGSRDNGRGLLEKPERARLKKRGGFRFLETKIGKQGRNCDWVYLNRYSVKG